MTDLILIKNMVTKPSRYSVFMVGIKANVHTVDDIRKKFENKKYDSVSKLKTVLSLSKINHRSAYMLNWKIINKRLYLSSSIKSLPRYGLIYIVEGNNVYTLSLVETDGLIIPPVLFNESTANLIKESVL